MLDRMDMLSRMDGVRSVAKKSSMVDGRITREMVRGSMVSDHVDCYPGREECNLESLSLPNRVTKSGGWTSFEKMGAKTAVRVVRDVTFGTK